MPFPPASQTHAACQVPLGTFLGSKLPKTMSQFQQQYKQWDDGVANVQKSRELSVGEGKSFWEAWQAGPTEALLAKAEDLQKLLEHATDEWKEVIIAVQNPEIGSASRKFEAKQGIKLGGGREEIGKVAEAAVAEHVKRVSEDLASFRQDLAARVAEAKQLLPVVTENAARLTAWLRGRAGKAKEGVEEWAAFMEKRRFGGANAFAAQLVAEQDAADKALQAALAVASGAGEMGFKAEAAALAAFAQSLDERKRVISRRQQRVDRESAEHAAVLKRAQSQSDSDSKRADAAAASAAHCVAFLQRLASPDLLQRGDAVAAAISALAQTVAEVWKSKMLSYGEQIEMSKADLGMNYVILFNKADEDLGRLSEQIKGALKEATEREVNKVSVRKEAMNMVKGLGKEGGFLAGFGFGKAKEEPKPAGTPAPPPAPTTPPDLVSWCARAWKPQLARPLSGVTHEDAQPPDVSRGGAGRTGRLGRLQRGMPRRPRRVPPRARGLCALHSGLSHASALSSRAPVVVNSPRCPPCLGRRKRPVSRGRSPRPSARWRLRSRRAPQSGPVGSRRRVSPCGRAARCGWRRLAVRPLCAASDGLCVYYSAECRGEEDKARPEDGGDWSPDALMTGARRRRRFA